MTYHFFHVYLLRALSRIFRQILNKIKLSDLDLYYFWVKTLIFEIFNLPNYLLHTNRKFILSKQNNTSDSVIIS